VTQADCCATHHQSIEQLVGLLVKAMRELGVETIALEPGEQTAFGMQSFDLYGNDPERCGVTACLHPHTPAESVH
jgi:hypothetical protein